MCGNAGVEVFRHGLCVLEGTSVISGHHHKQALCAVATRLVNRIGKVLRTGEAYELRDTDGTPISVALGKAIVAERFSIPVEIRNARRKHRLERTI